MPLVFNEEERRQISDAVAKGVNQTITTCFDIPDKRLGYIALLQIAAVIFPLAASMIKPENEQGQKQMILDILATVITEVKDTPVGFVHADDEDPFKHLDTSVMH